ncbi:YheT family hydrolase [Aestuariibaculum sediminum]|uniref:Alpha/beta fold hydrolase n=1 Tax=Aestuariibaculum sediminum TaxID=2770637 RepID=A0A8J6Q9R5_9FLAO|nr:alpha/beta fold hydrolase [Aestuariibaculum sediminum]MBD0832722.1 alpha/beta fold hydrolase [Aestuariibaculum sediminum]
MPIIQSTYKPSFIFNSGFIATVYSGLVRSVKLNQKRERITLRDGDFLDLDWSYSDKASDKVILCFHGLEGHGQRPYITGTAKLFNENNCDAICVNFRGCSGEDNLLFRSYHSGATEDLEDIMKHILGLKKYNEIYLYGISLGANLILKYLGERDNVPGEIKAAVAVSVPADLAGSCEELMRPKNRPYANRFLNHLKKKLLNKAVKFPDELSFEEFCTINTLRDFDDVYTAKAHGFKDATDYYEQSSCLQFLSKIKIRTLIINALNDSFLSPECYPVKEAKENSNLFLEMPKKGGHVGFIDKRNVYYNEKRALEFILNS